MGARQQTRTFTLRGEDIDLFSSWLERVQLEMGEERQTRLRVRLFLEEVLLRMRDHLGEEPSVTATCEKFLGQPRVRLDVMGEPFKPLGLVDTELGEWESSLRTAIGLSSQYSYEGGHNIVRLSLPTRSLNPVLRIALAVGISALFGFLGSHVIPLEMRQAMVHVLLTPLYEMWNRLLNAISGPIIFLTVATTLLNTRRIEERGLSSLLVIVRYFVLSFLVVAFALMCALPLFSLNNVDIVMSENLAAGMVEELLSVVPQNIFEPFVKSDTSQLLFLAFALGVLLIRLDGRVDALTQLVRQANMVGLMVAEWVSWLVPYAIGLFVCLEMWQTKGGVLSSLWKPLAIAFVISLASIGVIEVALVQRMRIRPGELARKLWDPFLTALRTGSLDASFAEAQTSCTRLLGIDAGFVKVGLPQGLVLYMPVSAVGTIVFTLFMAWEYEVQGSMVWYASAIVMAVVVFVATPPVPGANLLAYVALFSTLGIPDTALPVAMIYDIIFGIFAGAANQTMLQLEMVQQANRFGLLDRNVLREPMKGKR